MVVKKLTTRNERKKMMVKKLTTRGGIKGRRHDGEEAYNKKKNKRKKTSW
jgi:hypothetical protein